jgi:hypothetical protein
MESVKVPRIELRALEGNTASGLVWMIGVILLKLCLDVVRLEHFAGLDINVTMLLFASLVVLWFMLYESPEAYSTCLEELVQLELKVSWRIKRYR